MEFELYYLLLLRKEKKSCMGNCLEQPLFNAWTRGITPLAPLLDEGVATSFVHILSYIYLVSSFIFSYFILADHQREPVTSRTTHIIMLSLLYLVSYFYSSSYFYLLLSQLNVKIFREAVNFGFQNTFVACRQSDVQRSDE